MLHSCQTEKPRNSAKIDGHRLRRATARPFSAQNVGVLRIPDIDPAPAPRRLDSAHRAGSGRG